MTISPGSDRLLYSVPETETRHLTGKGVKDIRNMNLKGFRQRKKEDDRGLKEPRPEREKSANYRVMSAIEARMNRDFFEKLPRNYREKSAKFTEKIIYY